MSHNFEVRTRFRKIGELDELLTAWWESIPDPCDLHRTSDGFGWIFAPGASIRGCSVRMGERRFLGSSLDVRLSVCASRADWRIAYAFLRLAVERGAAAIDDNGSKLRLPDLTDASAEAMAKTIFPGEVRMLQHMMYEREQDPITLPNFRFSLVLTRDDLPSGPLSDEQIERLESGLASRTAKYRGARMAATLVLQGEKTAAVWNGEALVAEVVDFLIFPPTPGRTEMDDFVYLPWSEALEKLGTSAELIAGQVPSCHLRSIDPDAAADQQAWRSLCESARDIDELSSRR